MEKFGKKTRIINFYSRKNKEMVRLHSQIARDYAMFLEEQSWVERYEAEAPLLQELYTHVKRTGIRGIYFQTLWASNFLIHFADGRTAIHELVRADDLLKRSEVEKLEFSRRYWAATDMDEWKIVLITEGEA